MSRAFVKEPDGDQVDDGQPELPISEHPNYVTTRGLSLLKERQSDLLNQKNALDSENIANKLVLAQIERELRYLQARIKSALLSDLKGQHETIVRIGATVTVMDEQENVYQFSIVGEDEAAISAGKISWISPLAKVLLGKECGDTVVWKRPVGDLSVEIDEIDYPSGE